MAIPDITTCEVALAVILMFVPFVFVMLNADVPVAAIVGLLPLMLRDVNVGVAVVCKSCGVETVKVEVAKDKVHP